MCCVLFQPLSHHHTLCIIPYIFRLHSVACMTVIISDHRSITVSTTSTNDNLQHILSWESCKLHLTSHLSMKIHLLSFENVLVLERSCKKKWDFLFQCAHIVKPTCILPTHLHDIHHCSREMRSRYYHQLLPSIVCSKVSPIVKQTNTSIRI